MLEVMVRCVLNAKRRSYFLFFRSLTNAEKNYEQMEKKRFALIYSCKKFSQYVYGKFIKSDHKPLETIIRKPVSSKHPSIQRFLFSLMKHDMQIEFVPGNFLHIAETSSRAHSPLISQTTDLDEKAVLMIHTLNSILSATSDLNKSKKKLIKINFFNG